MNIHPVQPGGLQIITQQKLAESNSAHYEVRINTPLPVFEVMVILAIRLPIRLATMAPKKWVLTQRILLTLLYMEIEVCKRIA